MCRGAPVALLSAAFLAADLAESLTREHGGFAAAEARQLDIHIQLMLDTCCEGLEDAGSAAVQAQAGVFTASHPSDFTVAISSFNVARSVAAGLHTTGQHCNQDFACSSGYLATHHASQALQAEECRTAFVTGVSVLLKPNSALGLYIMGVLSPSGRMRPFDTTADGMVWPGPGGAG